MWTVATLSQLIWSCFFIVNKEEREAEMTKWELIEFRDMLVELSSEENKAKTVGMPDGKFGKIPGPTAEREVGGPDGD